MAPSEQREFVLVVGRALQASSPATAQCGTGLQQGALTFCVALGLEAGTAPSSVQVLFPESCARALHTAEEFKNVGPCPLVHSAFTKTLGGTLCGAVQSQCISSGA